MSVTPVVSKASVSERSASGAAMTVAPLRGDVMVSVGGSASTGGASDGVPVQAVRERETRAAEPKSERMPG